MLSLSPSGPSAQTPVVTEHSVNALEYYHIFKGTPAGKLLHPFRFRKHPPLANLITAAFFLVFGASPRTVFLSLGFFIALLLWAILRLGALLKDERAGLLAGVLTLATFCFWEMEHHWFTYSVLKEYFPELLLAALVLTALEFMIRSDNFTSRKYSLRFGLACGLGLLTKWSFPIYLAPALTYTLWISRLHPPGRRNALLALALCCLIFLPWYALMFHFNHREIVHYFAGELSLERASGVGFPSPFSGESLIFYPRLLLLLMTPPIFIIFLFSLIRFIRRRVSPPITVALLASYVLLTLLPGKFGRPLIPLLPLCAVVVGTQCGEITPRWFRRFISGLIILLCIWAFAAHYYLLPRAWPLSRLVHPPGHLLRISESSTIRRILTDIDNLQKSRLIPTVCVVPFQRDFRVDSFIFWAYCDGYTFDFGPSRYIRREGWKRGLADADYVITLSGDLGPEWAIPRRGEIIRYLEDENGEFFKTFKFVKSYPLENATVAGLYGRREPNRGFEIFAPGEGDFRGGTIAVFSDLIALKDFQAEELPGRKLLLRYRWECLEKIPRSYKMVVHFKRNGELIFDQDHAPAHKRYPTHFWRKGEVIEEEYAVNIPEDAPGGIYQVWVGVWNRTSYMQVGETALEQKRDKVKVEEVVLK